MYYKKKIALYPQLHRHSFLPLGLLLCWLIFIIPLYLPNMGGSGLKVPQNIISWAVAAAVVATIWLTRPRGQKLTLTLTACGLLLAIILMGIPLFNTPEIWFDTALSRWLGLIGGWIFYLSMLQYRAPHFCRHYLFYAILIATLFQALIALIQFTFPQIAPSWFSYPLPNFRPVGVFQQVNVLASFLATGLALALMLFLLTKFRLINSHYEHWRINLLKLAIFLFPLLLVCLQSRIGWIGGSLVAILFIYCFRRTNPQQIQWAAGLMFLGGLTGIALLLLGNVTDIGLSIVSHESSTQSRYTMLIDTLAMIAQKPIQGWGYGGFEYSFQHFRIAQTPAPLITEIARHPHNELLLWWVEGGIVAFIGTLILLGCGFRLVWKTLGYDRSRYLAITQPHGEALSIAIALLPLVLHTQTEYPFMLSSAQWVIFLLLFARWDRQVSAHFEKVTLSFTTEIVLKFILVSLSSLVLLFAASGLWANFSLTQIERNGLTDIESARRAMEFDPWVNTERWEYDKQTYSLLTFNRTQEPMLLANYQQWAENYLLKRIDQNIYAAQIAISQYQQDAITHQRLRQEAHILFPDDRRFFTSFIDQSQKATH